MGVRNGKLKYEKRRRKIRTDKEEPWKKGEESYIKG